MGTGAEGCEVPSTVLSRPPLTKPASRAAAVFCSAGALAMPAAELGITGAPLPTLAAPKPRPAPPTCIRKFYMKFMKCRPYPASKKATSSPKGGLWRHAS